MSVNDVAQRVREKISELEEIQTGIAERLEKLRSFLAFLGDGAIAPELDEVLSAGAPESANRVPERNTERVELPTRKSEQFNRVVEMYKETGNEWADTSVIAQVTGLPSHTIRQMLYQRYKQLFERRVHPEEKKRKQFRLTQSAYRELTLNT